MTEQLHASPVAVTPEVPDPRTLALVWIDARLARILRWRDGVVTETIISVAAAEQRRKLAGFAHRPYPARAAPSFPRRAKVA